jgi:hypothetical protein
MYGKQHDWISIFILVIGVAVVAVIAASCSVASPGSAQLDSGAAISAQGIAAARQGEAGVRSVSYLPGALITLPSGGSWPDVLDYGQRSTSGTTESSDPDCVRLSSSTASGKAWIEYSMFEAESGRSLKTIQVYGEGTRLTVFLNNYITGHYDNRGSYDLNSGAFSLVPAPAQAFNGFTRMRLLQEAPSKSEIDRIYTYVAP